MRDVESCECTPNSALKGLIIFIYLVIDTKVSNFSCFSFYKEIKLLIRY